MCVNDILTHGAEPLFFMQCFNCGSLNPDIVSDVVAGIANGCKQANCTLISKCNVLCYFIESIPVTTTDYFEILILLTCIFEFDSNILN